MLLNFFTVLDLSSLTNDRAAIFKPRNVVLTSVYSFFPDPDPEVEAGDQSGSGSNPDPGL